MRRLIRGRPQRPSSCRASPMTSRAFQIMPQAVPSPHNVFHLADDSPPTTPPERLCITANSSDRCPLWVQKRTSRHLQPMSALPPKADIGTQPPNVRFVAKLGNTRLHNPL